MHRVRPNTLLSTLSRVDEPELFGALSEIYMERHTLLQATTAPIEHVYFPVAGMISLQSVMDGGQSVESAAIGYDSATGFNGALSGRNANCQAVVQLDLTALRIAKVPFLNAYNSSYRVRQMIHAANELLVEQVQQTAACHALHRTESRLARWLLQTHDYAGIDVFGLTQEFIAEMMGVQRTTVTEVAQMFQKERLIKYTRGHVTILDREGLEERSCECYRIIAPSAVPEPPRLKRVARPPSLMGSQGAGGPS
jgi:CRP-like cAMP-binding protein